MCLKAFCCFKIVTLVLDGTTNFDSLREQEQMCVYVCVDVIEDFYSKNVKL